MKKDAYIAAVVQRISVVNESVSRSENIKRPTNADNKKLTVATNTGMDFGVRSEQDGNFMLRLDYSVDVLDMSEQSLATYKAEAVGEFKVIGKHGFEGWDEMPKEAPVPYFSYMHHFIRERAKQSFGALGLNRVVLPIPDELNGSEENLIINE